MPRAESIFRRAVLVAAALTASACAAAPADLPFTVTEHADFEQPWAMTFLPDGALLVTEMRGKLIRYHHGQTREIAGVPEVAFGGQGGFGDVVAHPDFAANRLLYLSYAEPGSDGTRGAAVARATLEEGHGRLTGLEVIWRQSPKVTGDGHFGHRLAFGPDGHLWITASDRQKMSPAQDTTQTLGKIVRLNDDGSVPADNPFADAGGVTAEIWSLGHRNMLGIAFDDGGRLWAHEMGPAGGDELNRIEPGANYGWPEVSEGNHYDGTAIPSHAGHDQYREPVVVWNPVISPAGLIIYGGERFPEWQGSAFIGGLSSQALIRVMLDGDAALGTERFEMGERIREVEEGPDGSLWLLEDGRRGGAGRLLQITPRG